MYIFESFTNFTSSRYFYYILIFKVTGKKEQISKKYSITFLVKIAVIAIILCIVCCMLMLLVRKYNEQEKMFFQELYARRRL